jgi:hypothetical protein
MPFDFNAEAAKLPPDTSDRQAGNVWALIMESERAFTGANPEREALLTVNDFDVSALDNLPAMGQALKLADDKVGTASDVKAKSTMKPVREKSDALISKVVGRARYYCRNDQDAQRHLDRIGDTGAVDDRYGDLHRLATFIQAHPQLLADNPDLPADAAEQAIAMATQLATQDNSSAMKAAVAHRNLAYWMLSKALSDVRAAVRYRFASQTGKEELVDQVCGHVVKPRKKAKAAETSETPGSTTPSDLVSE